MKRIIPIINTAISVIALVLTIIMNVLYKNMDYKILGNTLWIVLESGVILLFLVSIFYDLSYIHYLGIFAAISPIIVGFAYIFVGISNPEFEIGQVNLFFIPHICIYLVLFGIELYYVLKYVKNKQNN